MSFIRGVYAVAIGVLIVLLVVFGIQTFYPAPPNPFDLGGPGFTLPFCPEEMDLDDLERELTRRMEEYREQRTAHYTGLFLVVLPLGALLVIGGTFVRRRLDTLGAGLILGGMGTMIYGIVPYHLDSLYRFIGIGVALAALIFVGLRVLSFRREG